MQFNMINVVLFNCNPFLVFMKRIQGEVKCKDGVTNGSAVGVWFWKSRGRRFDSQARCIIRNSGPFNGD